MIKIDFNTLTRVIAVLRNAEIVKDEGLGFVYPGCRGSYDNEEKGQVWCRCEKNELCQVKLAEALKVSQTAMTKFSTTIALLEEYNVINIRIDKSVAAKNKPRKYYSLNENWRENFAALLEDLVKAQEQRLIEERDDLMRSIMLKKDVASSRVREKTRKRRKK